VQGGEGWDSVLKLNSPFHPLYSHKAAGRCFGTLSSLNNRVSSGRGRRGVPGPQPLLRLREGRQVRAELALLSWHC